jgi:release factor glutamine methyltransferase
MNVADLLAYAQTRGLDRLDAQLLVLLALDKPIHDRAWLIAHDTDTATPAQLTALDKNMQRRLAGEPLAYITGHQEFFGLDLTVNAHVLVPRPDTETLVEWALQVLTDQPNAKVVDLGTGSGAIALALKTKRPDLVVCAVDFSAEALAVAQSNAKRLQLKMQLLQGSWLEGIAGHFDLIVSNPPYIASADHHLEALRREPLQALASGADGLDDLRQIVAQAPKRLNPGGWLLLEHGYDQAAVVCRLLAEAGFTSVQSRCDLAGIERCSGGCFADCAAALLRTTKVSP